MLNTFPGSHNLFFFKFPLAGNEGLCLVSKINIFTASFMVMKLRFLSRTEGGGGLYGEYLYVGTGVYGEHFYVGTGVYGEYFYVWTGVYEEYLYVWTDVYEEYFYVGTSVNGAGQVHVHVHEYGKSHTCIFRKIIAFN